MIRSMDLAEVSTAFILREGLLFLASIAQLRTDTRGGTRCLMSHVYSKPQSRIVCEITFFIATTQTEAMDFRASSAFTGQG
jgi:hypothetical protein